MKRVGRNPLLPLDWPGVVGREALVVYLGTDGHNGRAKKAEHLNTRPQSRPTVRSSYMHSRECSHSALCRCAGWRESCFSWLGHDNAHTLTEKLAAQSHFNQGHIYPEWLHAPRRSWSIQTPYKPTINKSTVPVLISIIHYPLSNSHKLHQVPRYSHRAEWELLCDLSG